MGTPHKATPGQWGAIEGYKDDSYLCVLSCILELRDRLAAAEQRIEALEATASAPADHLRDAPEMVATDEQLKRLYVAGNTPELGFRAIYNLGRQHGAAQAANPTPEQSPAAPAPAGGLIKRVADNISQTNAGPGVLPGVRAIQAEAAILAVADVLEILVVGDSGMGRAARWLREEVQRHG